MTESLYNPATRMIFSPSSEIFVDDLDASEWLRDRTLNKDAHSITGYQTVAEHFGRTVSLDEYRKLNPRVFGDFHELYMFLGERVGFNSHQSETFRDLAELPELLLKIAESRMNYMVKQNMCGFNIM